MVINFALQNALENARRAPAAVAPITNMVDSPNIARGILVTASGWDTPPSNLSRCTDGLLNATGTGITVQSGAGTYGVIIIDFGASKNSLNHWWLLSGLVGMWSSAGSVNLKMACSDDMVAFTGRSPQIIPYTSTTIIDSVLLGAVGAGRYAILYFENNAAATCNANISELLVWPLKGLN